MLSEIRIENVAVIEKATVEFGDGFNVLTGETGAGKSILIDSINAILGSRTSREIVRSHTPKATIRATFCGIAPAVQRQLADAGYEATDELLLYREITAEGKSTCRINGMPATAAIVRDICAGLINIHGQHDNQSLMNPSNHLGVLDCFAQNDAQYEDYHKVYKTLCHVKKQIDALAMDEDEKTRKMDALRYQIDEIEKAELKIGEEETLTEQKNLIRHAQTITQQLGAACVALGGDDDTQGGVELLGGAASALEALAPINSSYSTLSEKMSEVYYAARELASDLSARMETDSFDARALDDVEERLDVIYRLRQKYGMDIEAILSFLDRAREELDGIETSSEHLDTLYEQQSVLYAEAKALADVLTASRLAAFERFNEQISEALQFLNMPGIRFTLMHKIGSLARMGQDSVEFYISTNPGEEPKPLARIASGGELSRIMLAVKSALADKDDIASVIYDEIDTGVSGLAAGRIGEKLKQTSAGRQVICITHTAQIAALADVHLLIQKNVENERTYTQIHQLDTDARVLELARMVSGDKIGEIALANAREMLLQAKA